MAPPTQEGPRVAPPSSPNCAHSADAHRAQTRDLELSVHVLEITMSTLAKIYDSSQKPEKPRPLGSNYQGLQIRFALGPEEAEGQAGRRGECHGSPDSTGIAVWWQGALQAVDCPDPAALWCYRELSSTPGPHGHVPALQRHAICHPMSPHGILKFHT